MAQKRKSQTHGASPTAAQAKAARRAQSDKSILALERKAEVEALKAAAAAAVTAKKLKVLRDARQAEDDEASSEEEAEQDQAAQLRGSSSQRSASDELAQRVTAQAEDLREMKEMLRDLASRRGNSGDPLSVITPTLQRTATKRTRDTAPERPGRAHSEQEETFSDDDDALYPLVILIKGSKNAYEIPSTKGENEVLLKPSFFRGAAASHGPSGRRRGCPPPRCCARVRR